MRRATVERKTNETDISVTIDLDGSGACDVLSALGRHSLCDLTVRAKGDTWVDDHHTVEDVGIVIGQAIREALGDKRGIGRFGDAAIPMDEALVLAAIDVSGRGELFWDVDIAAEKVGTFDCELAREFFAGLARDAGITLHLRKLAGDNAHHIIEATFKACGRALRAAVEADARVTGVPSTKGSL